MDCKPMPDDDGDTEVLQLAQDQCGEIINSLHRLKFDIEYERELFLHTYSNDEGEPKIWNILAPPVFPNLLEDGTVAPEIGALAKACIEFLKDTGGQVD